MQLNFGNEILVKDNKDRNIKKINIPLLKVSSNEEKDRTKLTKSNSNNFSIDETVKDGKKTLGDSSEFRGSKVVKRDDIGLKYPSENQIDVADSIKST